MAKKAMTWMAAGLVMSSCLVYLVTTIVSLNCVTKGSNECARQSGIVAATFGCMLCMGCGLIFAASRGQ